MTDLLDQSGTRSIAWDDEARPEAAPPSIAAWPSGTSGPSIERIQVQLASPPRWLNLLFANLHSAIPAESLSMAQLGPQVNALFGLLHGVAPGDLPAPGVGITLDGVLRCRWWRPGHELVLRDFKPDGQFTAEVRRPRAKKVTETVGRGDQGRVRQWLRDFEPARTYEELKGFTNTSRGRPLVSTTTADRAERFLRRLVGVLPLLPTPSVLPGPEDKVGMTWASPSHHVQVDIFPDGHLDLFHDDLRTGRLWSDLDARDVTPGLVRRLRDLSEEALKPLPEADVELPAMFHDVCAQFERGERSVAMDRLYDAVDDRLCAGEREQVDRFLETVLIDRAPTAVLLGLLTITRGWKDVLGARLHLVRRIRDRVAMEEPAQVDALLRGLD